MIRLTYIMSTREKNCRNRSDCFRYRVGKKNIRRNSNIHRVFQTILYVEVPSMCFLRDQNRTAVHTTQTTRLHRPIVRFVRDRRIFNNNN